MTLSFKEVLGQFRAAQWSAGHEIDSFSRSVGALQLEPLLKLFEVLTSRGAERELDRHRARCAVFEALVRKAPPARGLFVPLVRSVAAADPHLRAMLVSLIPVVNDEKEFRELCELLRVADSQVRQHGAQLIGALGGKEMAAHLGALLTESSFAGRKEALDALARCAGPRAIPIFRQVLRDGSHAEKLLTLKYLCDPKVRGRSTSASVAAIASALEDPHLRIAAIRAFTSICSEEEYFVAIAGWLDARVVDEVKAAIEGLQRFRSPRVVAALSRKLRAGPSSVRLAVISTLAAIGSDEILPVLVEALSYPQAAVRSRASETLSNLSRSGRLDLAVTVIWLSHSRDVNVRRMAVDVAKNITDQGGKVWPRLLRLLRDADWWVRERVADAIIEMAGRQLTPHIIELLRDPSDVVRRFAVDVLVRLADPQSFDALIEVAQVDPDWWARERAIEALAKFGEARACGPLTRLLDDAALRIACLEALTTLGSADAVPRVAALLVDPDPDVRLASVRCLGSTRHPNAQAALANALADTDPRIRVLARDLLGQFAATARHAPHVRPIDSLLEALTAAEGDDLLLAAGHPPTMKRLGRTSPLGPGVFSELETRALLEPVLRPFQWAELERRGDTDLSYECSSKPLRFRVNVFRTEAGTSAAFRHVRGEVLDFDTLGLPPVVRQFAELKNGLVLIGGPTGSGKSSTLAALIAHIIRTRSQHIITLEDPIEVVHASGRCLVNQRELGAHVKSFSVGLRASLREDPDVLLIGELRDLSTIRAAVSAAETGHLVFATVHTVSAEASVDRLINVFPVNEQDQVRAMLADSLRAIVCQHLLVRRDKPGRALAIEVMVNNHAVSNLIRKAKAFQLPSIIAASRELGMQSMDGDLLRLVQAGRVSAEDAYVKASSKREFEAALAAERATTTGHLPSLSAVLEECSEHVSTDEVTSEPSAVRPAASAPSGVMRAPVFQSSPSTQVAPPAASAPSGIARTPVSRSSPSAVAAPPAASAPSGVVRAPVFHSLPSAVAAPAFTSAASGVTRPPVLHPSPEPARSPPSASAGSGGARPPVLEFSSHASAGELHETTPASLDTAEELTRRARPVPPPSTPRTPPALSPTSLDDAQETSSLSKMPLLLDATVEPAPQAIEHSDAAVRAAWNEFLNAPDRLTAGRPALASLEAVLAQAPRSVAAHYFCGQICLVLGEHYAARAWFEATLELDPSHNPARQRLAAMEA